MPSPDPAFWMGIMRGLMSNLYYPNIHVRVITQGAGETGLLAFAIMIQSNNYKYL